MPQVQSKASIGAKELVSLLTVFVGVNVFLSYPQTISKAGMEASWMLPLISGAITLILFLIVERVLFRYFPGLDIVEVAKEVLGSYFATMVSVVLGIYFIAITALTMRQFMENVTSTVLPTTPITVVGVLFILATGYVAYQGLEGIARVSYFALPVLIAGVLAVCLLNWNWLIASRVFPFWGTGIEQVVWGALRYSSIFANVLLLCVIYPHAHDPKSLRKVGIQSIVLSALIIAGFTFVYNLVFPPSVTGKIAFPLYQLARMIYMGRFIQNLESGFVFLWVTAAVIKMAITLWSAAYLFSSGFGWPTFRPAIPALGLLAFALSMLPSNIVQAHQWDELYVLTWGWIVVFGLPLLIVLGGALIRSVKRGRAQHV